MAQPATLSEISQQIIDQLNNRSGINIDFDEDTMQEIKTEIEVSIANGVTTMFENRLLK